MILRLFLFEVRYWLRHPMLWFFIAAIAGIPFMATAFDDFSLRDNPLLHRNAPFNVYWFYCTFSGFSLLMVTAIVNVAAIREFTSNTAEIIFSTPVRKRDHLLGRFLGSTFIALLPSLGISVGILVASLCPWVAPEKLGPLYLMHHLQAILLIAVPNVLFTSAVIFAVATLLRSTTASFITAIVLIVCYGISRTMMGSLEHGDLAAMLDPFGSNLLAWTTKYWTVADKNTLFLPLDSTLIWNRVIWLAISALVFAFAYVRFSFHERRSRTTAIVETDPGRLGRAADVVLPAVTRTFNGRTSFTHFRRTAIAHFLHIIGDPVFIIVTILGLISVVLGCLYRSPGYGMHFYPVTYEMVAVVTDRYLLFVMVVITYYSGALIWADRELHTDEIQDALPTADWIGPIAKFASLLLLLIAMYTIAALFSAGYQLTVGYTRIEPLLYVRLLVIPGVVYFGTFAMLAMLAHTLVNNKYLGYFVFIGIFVGGGFAYEVLHIENQLTIFSGSPPLEYSDLAGFGPYWVPWVWFSAYWWIFGCLLLALTVFFQVRGQETGARWRMRSALPRIRRSWKVTLPLIALWLITGGWIHYNTDLLNHRTTEAEEDDVKARYEKAFKAYEELPQPHYTDVDLTVDLDPEARAFTFSAEVVVRNVHNTAINAIHFTLPEHPDLRIDIPGATLVLDDEELGYRIYELKEPLLPGAELRFAMKGAYRAKGFENPITFREFTDNGTFFTSLDLLPVIGYLRLSELTNNGERAEHGLPKSDGMPPLSADPAQRMAQMIPNSGLMRFRTTISTAPDQIAVSAGSLKKEWTANGRHYFQYEVDHPAMINVPICSGRYEVARDKWRDTTGTGSVIDLEVYYDKAHAVNVPRMISSMKRSLDFGTTHYGPYPQKQARIVEFTRFSDFAQSLPGTMPYSESKGFITDLTAPDDLDMVFFVVAHEMAHQWWGMQVSPAYMQGSSVLVESIAEYTALMTMEKEFGRDRMRKFLRYEGNMYARARGRETRSEPPLIRENGREYIYYYKGCIALYCLRDFLGEDTLNSAFRSIMDRFADAPPPYPTSLDLYAAIRKVTPDSLLYLLDDNLQRITFYSNGITSTSGKETTDGGYDITVTITAAKNYADSLGHETPAPMNDWMDLGFYTVPDSDAAPLILIGKHRERMTTGANTFTYHLPKKPDLAIIDPDYLFFDRNKADNAREVK
ncbi:MAG: ABC transporter permease [Flavobacteriales bacterium]|nr:ABC transporter permease [Flavobacteriales bacterium]